MMIKKWEKLGLVYCPSGDNRQRLTHAMLPVPLVIDNEIIRVFFGSCDNENVGRVFFVDVDANDPKKIIHKSFCASLGIGEDGAFDDHGVVPLSIINNDGLLYLYYVGFKLGSDAPYYMFTGLAISGDNGVTFSRISNLPILGPNNEEKFARCGSFVQKLTDSNWKMWYIGSIGSGWTSNNGKLVPLYNMRYIESEDGIDWGKDPGKLCLSFKSDDEHGFGRPYIWNDNALYRMYYSIRTYSRSGYHVGYAESKDGKFWNRKDELCDLQPSLTGWDSKSICYPSAINVAGKEYIFYNGNGYGRTGFGVAVHYDNTNE